MSKDILKLLALGFIASVAMILLGVGLILHNHFASNSVSQFANDQKIAEWAKDPLGVTFTDNPIDRAFHEKVYGPSAEVIFGVMLINIGFIGAAVTGIVLAVDMHRQKVAGKKWVLFPLQARLSH